MSFSQWTRNDTGERGQGREARGDGRKRCGEIMTGGTKTVSVSATFCWCLQLRDTVSGGEEVRGRKNLGSNKEASGKTKTAWKIRTVNRPGCATIHSFYPGSCTGGREQEGELQVQGKMGTQSPPSPRKGRCPQSFQVWMWPAQRGSNWGRKSISTVQLNSQRTLWEAFLRRVHLLRTNPSVD